MAWYEHGLIFDGDLTALFEDLIHNSWLFSRISDSVDEFVAESITSRLFETAKTKQL